MSPSYVVAWRGHHRGTRNYSYAVAGTRAVSLSPRTASESMGTQVGGFVTSCQWRCGGGLRWRRAVA